MEYCSLEDDPKGSTTVSRSVEDITLNLVSRLESGERAELPRFAWRLVPFYLMEVCIVRVYQSEFDYYLCGSDEVFDEVKEVLASIKINRLFLQSDSDEGANKLLRAMYFRPKSKVCVRMNSPWNSNLLFHKCNFSNVVEFHWSTSRMLARDARFLLHSKIDSLFLEAPCVGPHGASIIQRYVQNFVFGNARQSKCEIQCGDKTLQQWCTKLMRGEGLFGYPSDEYQLRVTYSEHLDSFTITCIHREKNGL